MLPRKTGPAPIFNYRKRPRQAIVADPETHPPSASHPLCKDPAGNPISQQPSSRYGAPGTSHASSFARGRGARGGAAAAGAGHSYRPGAPPYSAGPRRPPPTATATSATAATAATPGQSMVRGNWNKATADNRQGHSAMAPTAMAPRAIGPTAMGPRAMGPTAMAPRAIGPRAMTSSTMGPRPMGPRAMTPSTMGPRPMGPRAMTPSTMGSRPMTLNRDWNKGPTATARPATGQGAVAGPSYGAVGMLQPQCRQPARSTATAGGRNPLSAMQSTAAPPRPQKSVGGPDDYPKKTKPPNKLLRVLTLRIAQLKRAFGLLNDTMPPFLFCGFGIVDSATVFDTASSMKSFTLRDETGRIQCIFCEIDRQIPPLLRGQWYRAVGVARGWKQTLQCLALRPASAEERQAARTAIDLSTALLSDMCLKVTEL